MYIMDVKITDKAVSNQRPTSPLTAILGSSSWPRSDPSREDHLHITDVHHKKSCRSDYRNDADRGCDSSQR